MTNKPKEFYVLPPFLDMSTVHTCFAHKPNNFHTENGKYTHVIEAGPALEKIKRLEAENEELKAQVDELKTYLTNYQKDMIEKNKLLEIAVKACQLYEQAFDDTGNDYSHLVCLEEAQKLLEQIQKMLRKNEGDEQW